MVYKIYGNKAPYSGKMFDIELYLTKNELEEDSWYVELHSISFISGSVEYIKKHLSDDKIDDFINDCITAEELRGWLWESEDNYCRTKLEAEDFMNKEIRPKLETMINKFITKWGLYLATD